MDHFLFAAYLILIAWLLTKVRFFTHSGLTNAQLIIIFLLKVMAGIIYGWIGVYYGGMAQMVDTWAYHYQSLYEYELLKRDPLEFVLSLFNNSYPDGYTRFLSEQSWWNDLKGNVFIKILAVFHLFTFGNYYISLLIFTFFSLIGPVALFRVMLDVFPGKKLAVMLATFLVPSFIYWTSGLHKDGLIFSGVALACYYLYFGLKENRFGVKRIAIISICLLMVLGLRNFLIIPTVPALFAWILSTKLRYKPVYVFTAIYLIFITIFFSTKFIHPKLDMAAAVVDKQQAFMKLAGSSTIHVQELEPTFTSFVKNTPQALTLTFLRPFPNDVRHLLSMAAAMEIYFILFLFVLFLIWRRNGTSLNAFLLFCIFFSISLLLMIGYTVNNLGAIVRYRSIVFPFLVVPMVAQIDWRRIGKTIFSDIIKK